MLRPTFLGAAFAVAALPLQAQDFSDRSEVLGTFTVTVGGEDHTLYALDDLEGRRDFISITEMAPFAVYAATGGAANGDSGAASPYVTVMIGPFMTAPGTVADVEWRAGGTAWFANSDSEATGTLSDYSLGEDGSLSFSFSAAEMIPMETDAAYTYVRVEGVEPLPITGRFEGRLPSGD